MPLPISDMPWPPIDPRITSALADWDAWYASEPHRLTERYELRTDNREVPVNRPSQYRGGITGRVARWFWGEPVPHGEKNTRLHVPLAGDIARTSADLLFAEPPKLLGGNDAATARLDELVAGGLHPTLSEAAELCAALGGVYPRVCWDTSVADRPWISSVAADCAVPDFSYGALRAVTFWSVVQQDGQTVWRHLECHERGVILHGLYQGTTTQLGVAVPLTEVDSLAGLAGELTDGNAIETGIKVLTAAYIPNIRPARAWRRIPSAAGWGRSDFQGIEGTLDALDETYSSWMRDIRNGKGRVVVPNSMLESAGPGHGATWNPEREIYSGLNMLQRPGDSGQLDVVQFAIRVQEHKDTCAELTELAIRQAGYSGATFGIVADGQGVTATEIRARQQRSQTTRGRKITYAGPAVSSILGALLALEAGPLFGVTGLDPTPPTVEFTDSITESPNELATTAQLLRAAEAASTDVLVRMVHPDWDDDQVKAEVAAVRHEAGTAVPDPMQAGDLK